MKQDGKCIVGDPIRVDDFTSDWLSVRVHPATYYRRIDDFYAGFTDVKGFYTRLDQGEYVVIRFSEKEDLTAFHRRHNNYI